MYGTSGSDVQHQPPGVLNDVLHALQECDSLPAINKSVVVGQGHIHDGPWHDILPDHLHNDDDVWHAFNIMSAQAANVASLETLAFHTFKAQIKSVGTSRSHVVTDTPAA